MTIANRQLGILASIFLNTERPDKVSVTMDKTTRDLIVEYRDLDDEWFKELSAALEPKPPSLKEQALKSVAAIENMSDQYVQFEQDIDIIRRALEKLDD